MMTVRTVEPSSFLADGQLRASVACRKEIENRVLDRFRDQYLQASLLRTILLSIRIEFEIRRALDRVAPKDGCY